MTPEEKILLLKDLCGRLPYHPTVKIYNDSWEGCKIGEFDNSLYYHHVEAFVCDRIEIKPYLRPMSSMTDEEKEYIKNRWCYEDWTDVSDLINYNQIDFCDVADYVDWLNEHHFDYRGLIEKGLALDVSHLLHNNI